MVAGKKMNGIVSKLSDEQAARSDETMTIWLTVRDARLEHLLKDISTISGTPYFSPHITLIGGDHLRLHTIDDLLQIAEGIRHIAGPIHAECPSIKFGDTFFQTMYLNVDLRKLREESHERLTKGTCELSSCHVSGYQPHISLLYKENLSPELLKQIGDRLNEDFILKDELSPELKTIEITSKSFDKRPVEIDLHSVDVVYCPLDRINEWKVVKSFPFRGASNLI